MAKPQVRRTASLPLLAAMGSLVVILLIAAFLTGEWVFLILGLFGLAAGVVPFLSKR